MSLTDKSIGKAEIDTGDDNDTVEVDVGAEGGYNAGNVTVSTGDGDDSVTLTNKDGGKVLDENRRGNITVDLGTGVNEATVSTDVAGIVPNVTVSGEGNDHVHLTGTLNSSTTDTERISGTKERLSIAADKGALGLALQNIESLTDDLKNKRTKTLTAEEGKKVTLTYEEAEAFTNYVLKAESSKIDKIVIRGKDGQPMLLSSLVIDTPTTWDGDNKLIIPEDAIIDAQGMNVRLTAKDIEVDGTIKAGTVQLEALDGTGMYSRNFSDLYSSFSGTIPVPGLDQAGSALAAGAEMAWDLVNINDKATITIGEKGAVIASNDVIMLAKVEQNGTLISLIPLNVVNVKVAHASIDIAGKVYAGVKNIDDLNSDLSNVEFDEGHGTVRANAQIKTTIGYDEKGHMSDGWPLAVSVVYANASVNVREGATVEAAGDVQLGTKSEVKAATRADSGLGGLPAAVAVAVLINDVHTTVNGTVNAKGGDVKLTANGDINARTLADKGAGQKSMSGGYAAVTVALQDVKAELGKTAVVNAKGQAQVLSNAVEKVENRSTSGKEKSEVEADDSVTGQIKTAIIEMVTGTILPKVVEFVGKKYFPDSAEKKLQKAIDKVSNGNHSVKLADNAQKHGDVSTAVDTMDGKTRVSVFVTPREGYKVKQVLWRGYNAGDDKYTMGEAIGSGNDFSFIQNVQNVMVFVKYEEVEAPETPEDRAEMDAFFKQYEEESEEDTSAGDEDISSLLDGLNSSINSVDDDEEDINEQLKELSDEIELVDLTRTGANGSILTLETENDDLINPLKKVYTGQKFELIPNPKDGYKLKNGGLTAMYHVTEKVDDKDVVVTKKVVINPDDQGRYYFEVPAKDKLDVSQGITIDAAFEKGEASKDADKTQLQLTGTVAVAVTDNDNRAVIAEGAQVNAGGVELNAVGNTDVTNVADGTAASKEEEKKKNDDYKIKRPDSKEYAGYDVEGLKFGLLADATQNGSIKVEKADGVNVYEFVIEATPEAGYKAGTALVTYYQGGEKKTAKLEPDEDGKYHFNLAGSGLNADEGSTAVVSFGFVGTEDGDVTVSDVTTSAPQVIISNSIQIAYNALKEEKYDRIAGYAGKILYNDSKNKKDDDGNITAYAFVADPDAKKGYALDGKLTATYKDASGKEQTKELTEENGVWYLDMSGIPAGAPIKVSGKFKDDLHDFKVDEKKTVNGKVTLHDEKVKTSDKPKITVTPNAGFAVGDIVVTYKDNNTLREKTLKLSAGDLVQVKKDGKVVEGLYELKADLPEMSIGDVTVSASFNRKSIGLYAGENDKATDYTLSEKNAAKGDKVTVTPNADKLKAGYKVTKVTVTDATGKTVAESTNGSFTVSDKTEDTAQLTVKAELGLKDIEIKNAKLDHGTVTASVARADRGEKVTLTIKPDDNFRLKSGTLKAVVTSANGNTEEVFASRQNDTTYTFDMPSDIAKDSTVSFIGEFEPGQSDSSAVETSLGAGIAVTVSNSESRADVSGEIESQGSVKVQAEITGGVKTESKAGYSKGNIGMGGAVSVQVASMDAKTLIHDTADIEMDGKLTVDSKADITYNVNADASGSKEAAKVGVGAGIAVAVNGSDVFAGVQDGASIDHRDDSEAMKGFSVTAVQKLKDEVKAKAGAAGGTAVVPVAAVDVIAAKANAYMGEAFTGKLKLTENAAVSAQTDASHTISADASASGKGAGVGGAFGVTVISDKATAKLAQSVDASQVTVAAQTIASVANTATASASGGKTGGKSPDKQADGLIGGASKLAGQNKSSGVSGNNIDKMTKDRQKGETSEGSVAVAGAVVVNVQNSTSRAEIVDGVDVKASGLLAVTALNGTTSKVKANASTTNSNVGVGVGVAVNIVGLQNIARMGNGEFEAAMLKVAANTKETTPEEKKAEASKAKDKDAAASELGEMVNNYMTDLAKEIGLDQYVPASLLGTILDPIVSDVTNSLLTSTGLDKLFGDGGLQAKYDKAIELLQGEKSALVSLPEKLIEPMMEIVTDALDLGSLTDEQYTALMEALYKEFTQKLKDNLMDYETLGSSVFDTLKGSALEWVKKEAPGILKGMFKGNEKKENWKKFGSALKKYLGDALLVEIKRITTKTFEQALGNVKVPGLSLQNRSRAVKAFKEVKDSWKAGKITNIFEDAVSYVTDTFKEQVFDYEQMISSLANTDWVDKISTALRSAAKDVSVELGNEAISWLTSTLGVELEAEQESATGHVVDTQAISGAGTKNVGVAGSVAITVLNAETKASIGNGGKLEVSGDMTVDASELRSVKNVASAALDAKGNAKDNKASENKDNKNIGGGNDATSIAKNDKNTTNLSVGVGGTASIVESEKGQDRPKLHIKLKDGYKLPEGDKVNFTYTNKDGFEVNGTVVATKEGDEWVIDTANDEQLKKADKDTLISLEVKPEEVLHKIVDPDASLSDQGVEKGAVTVSVKDRKVNDDNTISARAGETVEVKIAKKEGRVLNGMGYSYKDADGKVHEVELNPATGTSTGKEKAFTLVSSNEKEIIYTFTMPDGDVDTLLVSLVEGQEEQPSQDASTAAKDKNGASVGVGAAFSMVYGDTQTHAEVGERAGTVTAGAMNVTAASDHKENISATAGTDPMSGDLNTADSKKISLDASVALNILDTDVKAKNDANATDVRGYVDGEEEKSGDLTVTAKENAVTETTSSAFAVGGQTAVGASVAINIANSGVKAQMPGDATVDGNATVSSNSHSEDTTKALATAMGADMARVAGKIGDAAESLEEKSNKVLDGSYLDKAEDKKENQTSNKINDRLNEKKGDSGKSAKGGAATSSNVLRSQEVKTQNGEEGSSETGDAMGEVSGQVGNTLGVDKKQEKQKVEVAAAVGLTIASHEASTEVGRIIAGKKIETTSENTGNFNTMGTGAAMSLAEKSNAIAMGVAVSVNSNKSGVKVNGDLESTDKEDVTVTSKLTQNMDGDFQGKLAAQSLAGSVSGKGGGASIAGAVSVVVSKGKSTVEIAGGTASSNRSIKGGNVTVEATDKSKITARAGGLSLSTGAAMGMGIASTNIITSNGVSAKVGDYTTVEANSFKLNAEKQEVTAKDFKNLIDMRYLVTDSSKLSDAERESANTGLIDFHKGEDDKNYKVSVNLDSEKLLDAMDGLNFLSGQNTYAEAIAGSISGGASSSLAGSFAVVVTNNDVKASMGKSVKVTAASGDVDVNAKDGNTTRIIAGSLSAAPATNSTGATVAVLVNSDTVDTEVGENAELNASGNISQTAEASGDQQVFTAAMSLASGANQHQDSDKDKQNGGSGQSTDTGASVGGAINVIVSKIHANNVLGDNAKLTAGGNADVTSKAKFDLMAISGSAGVAAGGGTAAGGTVNVIVDSTHAKTNVGDNAKIEANKNLTIGSDVSDQLISGTASLSAAGSSGMTDGMAGAAVVNVIVSHSKANTAVGEAADLAATTGDMKINANNDAWMLNASLAVAGAKNLAVGGAFNVNVFGREATVDLKSGKLNAGGNLAVQTSGKDTGVMAGLTVVANSTTNGDPAVNGNIGVTVESNKIGTKIADGITATAGKNALFESYFSDYTVAAAGSITGSGGGSSLSGTVVTVVKNNDVRTELGASTIAGLNGGNSATSLSNKTVNGVYVGANAQETQYVGAAGMAAAGGSSINGEIVTLVNNNKVIADASKAKLSSYVETVTMSDPHRYLRVDELDANGRVVGGYERWAMYIEDEWNNPRYRIYKGDGKGGWIEIKDRSEISDVEKSGGAVTVDANDDTRQMLLAGGISVSSGLGAGAAAAVVVSNKTVEAKAHDMTAYNNVNVTANNHDRLAQLALSVGVSTGTDAGTGGAAVQIGAAIQSLGSKANAISDGDVTSETGAFNLTANNTTSLTNVAAALALSRDIAATPVFAYTGFSGEATANLKSGTVNAQNGVNVAANSNKEISQYTVGVAASGSVALSGALSVMTLKDQTNALVAAPVDVTSNSMNVNADSDYTLRGASGTLAGSIGNAVALNGMVSIVKANTLAEMAGKANVKASGLTVKANSRRDIINAAATVSAAGTGAISAGVMALVVGDKMDQEAADQLTYGSSTNKDRKLFDADAMIGDLAGRGIDTSAMSGMSDDLSGNGATTDTTTLGHTEGGKQTFDVASGYSDGTDGGSKSASETGDVQRSKQIGSTAYTDSPKDAVIARIAETADITGGVKVTANQTTLSDLYGASVAVGGDLGGGISIALAKLRSNVLASSTGTIHAEDQDVTIEAISDSASAKLDADEASRSNALIGTLGDKVKPENRTIRAIGLAAGGSLGVGGAVSAAFVRLDNITDATLAGHVEKAKVIDVNGKADYNNILAATIAAGGGTAGIAGSLAIAVADGTVNARLGKNKTAANAVENDGTFSGSGKVNVKTDSTFAANAIAVSAAGGVVGAAGGLGLATNNLTQNTAVERGVKLTNTSGSGALNVEGKSTSTANSYLMGLSIGSGAVGLGVSIAKVKPTLNTTVGVDGATSGTTDLTGIKTVDIKNDVTSKAESKLMSAAIGGVTVGVNVMTVFNDTNATAKAANLTGTVDDLKIAGLLGAQGVSDVTTFSGSGLGLGVTVNYVDVNSKNNAEADLTNGSLIINKKLSVTTGDAAYSRETSATANSTTAEVGEGTIGVNTAITRNRAANVATITGKDVNAANVELKSYSKGTSDAKLTGISIGGVSIATSVVNARNEATSIASMNLSGALNGDLDALSDVQGTTDARLFTGGGALLGSVKTNVATTHGATNALLDVSIGKASDDWRTISAKVNGRDIVNTEIDNLSVTGGAVSVAAMVGGAHSKDVYDNKVRLGGSGTYKLHRIDVITGYEADTDSKVTPSKGGVDVSMVGVNMNEAFATGKVYAGSNLTVQDAKLVTDAVAKERANVGMSTNQNVIDDSKNADVNVLTVGTANVDAAIRPATFTMSVLGVAASKAVAEQKSTQAATLQLGNGGIEKAGNVYVQSVVTKGETNAAIGTSGTSKKDAEDKRVKLGTVSVDVNSAKATGSIASTASILGGATSYDTKMDWVDEGHYETEHKVYTDYNSVERYAWRDKKTGKTTDSDLEMVKQICKDSNIKWKDEWDQDPQDIINIMYGYATDETMARMPRAFLIAQKICMLLDEEATHTPWLGVDGKAQVSLKYEGDRVFIHTIVVSVQHAPKGRRRHRQGDRDPG